MKTNNKGAIEIDSERVSRFSDFVGSSTNRIDYAIDNSNSSFKPLKRTGLYKKGFDRVERGYGEIRDSLKRYSNVLNDYYNSLDNMEKKHIEIINEVKIPGDYSLNDTFGVSHAANVTLTKENGKAVNSDNLNVENNDINIGEQIDNKNLENINGDTTREVEYDASSSVNKEEINEMKKYSNVEIGELEDNSLIEGKENLGEVKTDADTEIREEEEQSVIQKKEIEDFNSRKVVAEESEKDNYEVESQS